MAAAPTQDRVGGLSPRKSRARTGTAARLIALNEGGRVGPIAMYAAMLRGAPMAKEAAKPASQSVDLTSFLKRGVSVPIALIACFCAMEEAVKTSPERMPAITPQTWRISRIQYA